MSHGRPLRIRADDCDETLPRLDEIMDEVVDLRSHLRDEFLPSDVVNILESWIVLLRLGIVLNDILAMYYRPRCPLPKPLVLARQENEIASLRMRLSSAPIPSSFSTIHRCHFEMYFK